MNYENEKRLDLSQKFKIQNITELLFLLLFDTQYIRVILILQKQPTKGVFKKRCSEDMQQI